MGWRSCWRARRGWRLGWWQDEPSDTYVTAYVLFGLVRAQDAGVEFEAERSSARWITCAPTCPPWSLGRQLEFDRLAFIEYALSQAGAATWKVSPICTRAASG
jgi:hypothetical protein